MEQEQNNMNNTYSSDAPKAANGTITDNEYIYVMRDSAGKMLVGVNANGEVVVEKLLAEKLIAPKLADTEQRLQYAEKKLADLLDKLSSTSNALSEYSEYAVGSIARKLLGIVNYTTDSSIDEQASVGSCPSESTANFCLYTTDTVGGKKYQFVAYYDTLHQLTVAMRVLTSGVWSSFEYVKLQSFVGYDGHCYIHMIVDDEGHLHLAANMHAQPLNYWFFTHPYSISHFVKKEMVGTEEDSVTYPHFFRLQGTLANGELLFAYRDGESGCGDHYVNKYENGAWSRLSTLFVGKTASPTVNAYCAGLIGDFDSPIFNPYKNCYELFFLWREGKDPKTCKNLCYVKTTDFTTFKTYNGTTVSAPNGITPDMTATRIDTVAVNGGLCNTKWRAYHSSSKGTLFCYHKYYSNYSQVYAILIKNDGTKLGPTKITSWTYKWLFDSSVSFQLKIEENSDNFIVKCGFGVTGAPHKRYYVRPSNLTVASSESIDATAYRVFPNILYDQKENTDAGVRLINDIKNNGYLLRYESGNSNGDLKPVWPVPCPSDLKVIHLV